MYSNSLMPHYRYNQTSCQFRIIAKTCTSARAMHLLWFDLIPSNFIIACLNNLPKIICIYIIAIIARFFHHTFRIAKILRSPMVMCVITQYNLLTPFLTRYSIFMRIIDIFIIYSINIAYIFNISFKSNF